MTKERTDLAVIVNDMLKRGKCPKDVVQSILSEKTEEKDKNILVFCLLVILYLEGSAEDRIKLLESIQQLRSEFPQKESK